jgi:hypothetical protein
MKRLAGAALESDQYLARAEIGPLKEHRIGS